MLGCISDATVVPEGRSDADSREQAQHRKRITSLVYSVMTTRLAKGCAIALARISKRLVG
jgi:hypothetical protein